MASQLFGPHNQHLKLLGERLGVHINSRGNSVAIQCDDGDEGKCDLASQVLTQLYAMIKKGKSIYPQDVDFACRVLERQPSADVGEVFKGDVYATSGKRTVSPKSLNQREYLDAIRDSDMTFGIGPAGTGKTYLAVAMAVGALARREVKRIVLTRPAVEAGEKLGFLPGDLAEKINPYLRPLYDALHDMLDFSKVEDYQESGIIEIAPLAFMRGRTLNDAFIILDEAQNTTPEQMKMFLTRLGFGSKAVITGDVTQIDLPSHAKSGLLHARRILENVKGVSCIVFDEQDVIRHPLVGRIVRAYDKYEADKG
ncbi:PhoH family protein [Pseudodesulfovibrio sediminis]|uniref:PhoH-like protein n=1 Tax=Pseudodesulfovibrio sediminis TaxID=2810563 RepID=A0ABN6ENA9_9BACT|nr:PhoH family protein [Pseudodesulfovibrio sediminis]BCS87683.1 phosphate starvation protein PhoH [Pseudodesulfovibrio sediminis]